MLKNNKSEIEAYLYMTCDWMLMSTWCISHAHIQTVPHGSSSNSGISFLHHGNKFAVIDPSILQGEAMELKQPIVNKPNSSKKTK